MGSGMDAPPKPPGRRKTDWVSDDIPNNLAKSPTRLSWIPAFAGMTVDGAFARSTIYFPNVVPSGVTPEKLSDFSDQRNDQNNGHK